ncbi:MAG TPA: type II toxin-antitoxin system VapB family antitoxin [Opitutaceae bacterium]
MKTTVDLPEDELLEAMKNTGAKTKTEAVSLAVADFNRRHRMAALTRHLGTFKDFMTQDDLRRMREDGKQGS